MKVVGRDSAGIRVSDVGAAEAKEALSETTRNESKRATRRIVEREREREKNTRVNLNRFRFVLANAIRY